MPAPTDQYWRERLYHLVENDPDASAATISRRIEDLARAAPAEERDRYPTERTVRELRAAFLKRDPAERRPYRLVMWPETFDAGLLPWEAAQSIAELMRFVAGEGLPRPTIRFAERYWKVSITVPDWEALSRRRAALWLALSDAGYADGAETLRAVESALLGRTQLPPITFQSASPPPEGLVVLVESGGIHMEGWRAER